MATAGFLGELGREFKEKKDKREAQDQEAKIALRDRKADEIEQAMANLRQRATLPPGQPGYLSPDALKYEMEQATKQLTSLYQPHEMPHLFKRLNKATGDAGVTASTKTATPGVEVAPGVTVPGHTTQIQLRPGMTLNEVLAAGAPAPEPNKYAVQRQQLKAAGFSDEQADHALRILVGVEPRETEAKTDFQVWREQNPDKPVEDWLKAKAENKPSTTGKKLAEPEIKDGIFFGVTDAKNGKRIPRQALEQDKKPADVDDATWAEAKSIYSDYKQGSKEKEDAAEAKFENQWKKMQQTVQNQLAEGDYKNAQKTITKAKEGLSDAIARVRTMDGNLQDALNGDQQAMISLVSNHIGMTLGAQKGARITRAVWEEAVESAPWLDVKAAKFNTKSGLLSGVTLTPDQMYQMVKLAHEKAGVIKQTLDDIKKDPDIQEALSIREKPQTAKGLKDKGKSLKRPKGATMKVPDKTGKLHWSNEKHEDLGLVEE